MVGHGSLLFLWIGYVGALLGDRHRANVVLTLPPLAYLVAIGLSSGNWTYGWYLLPVYPFLCLGAGKFLADTWDKPDLLRGFFVVTLLTLYLANFAMSPGFMMAWPNWRFMRSIVTIALVVGLTPFTIAHVIPARWAQWTGRVAMVACVVVSVVLSGVFVVGYERIYDTHRNLDREEFFDN